MQKPLKVTANLSTTTTMNFPLLHRMLTLIQLAHHGQTYNSRPYWHHCVRVALRLKAIWDPLDSGQVNQDLLYAALAHDIVEDSILEPSDLLIHFGFSSKVTDSVHFLTRMEEYGTYQEYINRLTTLASKKLVHPEVILIKLADNIENMNGLRFLPLEKRGRAERYSKSMAVLAAYVENSFGKETLDKIVTNDLDPELLGDWIGEKPTFL